MPKVINQDVIDKIAEYAGKNYSKSATAKELDLDRTTVRKYWPMEQAPEEGKVEQPTLQLSLDEEFNRLNKKTETNYELESLFNKIRGWKWETESLKARGKAAVVGIDFLREELDKAKSVTEVDKVCELSAKVKDEVAALLEENEPLRKQRKEQEEKERESLRQLLLEELAWVFPCGRDQLKKIVDRLVWNDVPVGLLLMRAEDLEWEDDTSALKPLITECANLLKGKWEMRERIMGIAYRRKKGILIPSDKGMEEKYFNMLDSLTGEVNEHSAEMVLKFNAALGHLAEERFVDRAELLSKETPEAVIG